MLHGGKRLGRFTSLQCAARSQWTIRLCQQCQHQQQQQRHLLTLAIETSCDDTAVAILETTGSIGHPHHQQNHPQQLSHTTATLSSSCTNHAHAHTTTTRTSIHDDTSNKANSSTHYRNQNDTTKSSQSQSQSDLVNSASIPSPPAVSTTNKIPAPAVRAKIIFHEKITARNTGLGGIHPLEALESHQANLATLVSKALTFLPDATAPPPSALTSGALESRAPKTFQYFRHQPQHQPQQQQQQHNSADSLSPSPSPAPSLSLSSPLPRLSGEMVEKRLPDFVSVTRGPGMRSNLACGLDTAKGLATAWQVPLVGVHHMQAHALTPRLVDALEREKVAARSHREQTREQKQLEFGGGQPRSRSSSSWGKERANENWVDSTGTDTRIQKQEQNNSFNSSLRGSTATGSENKDDVQLSQQSRMQPQFPFLTLLVSGGHTMLVHSKGLIDHQIIATTRDIAIGDALDKCGRVILPEEVKSNMQDTAYAKSLSEWVSATNQSTELWPVPKKRQFEIHKAHNQFGWQVQAPLADTRDMAFSFTGIATSVEKLFAERKNSVDGPITDFERLTFARTALGISFEHLGSRTIIALENLRAAGNDVSTLVVSGGVAANSFLRLFLRSMLDIRGFEHVKLLFPPPWLCTDNAVMIAWSGIEMFEAGYQSLPDIRTLRKWSMDPTAADGGILGVGGWT